MVKILLVYQRVYEIVAETTEPSILITITLSELRCSLETTKVLLRRVRSPNPLQCLREKIEES